MKAKLVLQKGAQSSEWGTPTAVLEVARAAVGRFDVDMATNTMWLPAVGARRNYTLLKPCPAKVDGGAAVWCNPPAGVNAVRWFWDAWCGAVDRGAEGGFLIYQIDHWRTLPAPPTTCYCVLWPKRLRFVGAPCQANFSSVLVTTQEPKVSGNVVMWR
jgi:hypothetical protein